MEDARTFTNRLADLLAREHAALGEFLVALSSFDERRLWLELGYASLFDFLHRELGLSKASASFRKKAVELIRRFPETLEPIRDGRLCLSSVFELAKVLTAENRREVLPRFFQLSKREAKVVAAALQPQGAPPLRAVVTAVRQPVAATRHVPADAADPPVNLGTPGSLTVVCPAKLADAHTARPPPPAHAAPHAPGPSSEPLTADLNRLHLTVPRRFLEKLEAAKAALSHSHPGAGPDEILEAALDLLLERHARRNGLVKSPRPAPRPSANPDHVPAHVRRAVHARDGGRCQWPVASGGVCGSTLRVELHHCLSRARGGPATVEDLVTLCGLHHDRATRAEFGDAVVDGGARRSGAPGGEARRRRPGPPRATRTASRASSRGGDGSAPRAAGASTAGS